MRRTAFVLWLSLLALPATAAAPVDAFTLKFTTLRNGSALGNTIMLHQFFNGDHPLLAQAYDPMTN